VTVETGSVIEDSVLLPETHIGHNVRLRRVIVDKFAVIPDGFTAGLDRAEDEARFHVTEQGTVLITPEMLGQEFHDLG
jgi:glucose-1-phosphate adenylyltransferase